MFAADVNLRNRLQTCFSLDRFANIPAFVALLVGDRVEVDCAGTGYS